MQIIYDNGDSTKHIGLENPFFTHLFRHCTQVSMLDMSIVFVFLIVQQPNEAGSKTCRPYCCFNIGEK